MSGPETYEKTPRNSVNRLRKRGHYDAETIHSIVDTSPILHVSFNSPDPAEDPFPTILPYLGCTGTYPSSSEDSDNKTSIYIHGYISSRLIKSGVDASLAVCIAATHSDGIVLALSPFHNSVNYRSAIIRGHARLVTDSAEKQWALERITDNTVSNRWSNSRQPPTATELKSTGVLKVDIVDASAKVRVGNASDDRADMKNDELMGSVWTGTVPSWTVFGEPVPTAYNVAGPFPDYLQAWIEDTNKKNKEVAIAAAHVTKS